MVRLTTLLALVCLGVPATPAGAEFVEVFGYAGVLGEWELNAKVAQTPPGDIKTFWGPRTMRHVGICAQAGPEEKSGDIRLTLSLSQLDATLSLTNEQCSFTGTLSDSPESYTGALTCRDRGDVPLRLWLKPLSALAQ